MARWWLWPTGSERTVIGCGGSMMARRMRRASRRISRTSVTPTGRSSRTGSCCDGASKFGALPRRRLAQIGLVMLVVLALSLAWHFTPLAKAADIELLRGRLAGFAGQPWAPLVVLAAFVAAGLVAFPLTILIAATAAAFGPWLGLAYAASGRACERAHDLCDRRDDRQRCVAWCARRAARSHSRAACAPGRDRDRRHSAGADRALHAGQPGGRSGRDQAARLCHRHPAGIGARPRRAVGAWPPDCRNPDQAYGDRIGILLATIVAWIAASIAIQVLVSKRWSDRP